MAKIVEIIVSNVATALSPTSFFAKNDFNVAIATDEFWLFLVIAKKAKMSLIPYLIILLQILVRYGLFPVLTFLVYQ